MSSTNAGAGHHAITSAMAAGRRADTARRRERVLAALNTAVNGGEEISVSAIARAALLTELTVVFVQLSDRLLIESLPRPWTRSQGICPFWSCPRSGA